MSILNAVSWVGTPAPRPLRRASFGGGWLAGERLTKIIYVDEAGTNIGAPVTVVAGVLIDQDREWDSAASRLEDLRLMVPHERREGFVFHATDLYSGGKSLPRKDYDKSVRFPILEKVFAAPRELRLPIFFAWQWKHPEEEGWDPKNEMFFRHAVTFLEALKVANAGMRKLYPGERASLTAEDAPDMRQWLAQLPAMLRAANAPAFFTGEHPFDSIIDTPNFSTKAGAPLLQFADAVAFAVRHYLSGHKDGLWAMQHLTGYADVEPAFAASRAAGLGSCLLQWRS